MFCFLNEYINYLTKDLYLHCEDFSNMKKLLFLFPLLLALSLSCNDKNQGAVVLSDHITLTATYENDTVFLDWNEPYMTGFSSYQIMRSLSSDFADEDIIAILRLSDSTSYVDYSVPINTTVYYRIIATATTAIYSSAAFITRDIQVLDHFPVDVALDKETSSLYLSYPYYYEVLKYNYEAKKTDRVLELNYKPGFLDIGSNGLGKELYVCGSDEGLQVYSADNLGELTTIETGSTVYSVASLDNGVLAVSLKSDPEPIRTISRASGDLISQASELGGGHLWYDEQKQCLFEAYVGNFYTSLRCYELDENSSIQGVLDFQSTASGFLSPNIFRVSPDGEYYITSNYGFLISYDNTHFKQLKYYPATYNDFCFSEDMEYVYACDYQNRQIDKYKVSGTVTTDPVSTKKCQSYPAYIFMLDDKLLILGLSYPASRNQYISSSTRLIIETIDLF